jgi:guanine deaminase
MNDMNDEILEAAFGEAFLGMRNNHGGPFGSAVVMNGRIIGKGHNCVTSTNDPTAHAEVMAIRDACKNIGTFDLSGAVLYATCEPCPMCMAAIYWARIDTVYYCSTRYDAAAIGFDDNLIYEELPKPNEEKLVKMKRVDTPHANALFSEWSSKPDKTEY